MIDIRSNRGAINQWNKPNGQLAPEQTQPVRQRKPKYECDVPRLCRAIETSRRILERYRRNRLDAVRQYVGSNYAEDGADKKVPLNLLAMYIQIVGRALVPKEPRVLLTSFERSSNAIVSTMQQWANERFEQIELGETLQRAVTDALFSIGIVKVALATPGDAANAYWSQPAGQPFAEVVDLDDFAFDAGAKRLRDAGFFAHRIRIPLDAAKEMFPKFKNKLMPSTISSYNPGTGDEQTSNIGRGSRASAEEFEDMTDLWEVYLPRKGLIVTLAGDELGTPMGEDGQEALDIRRWIGPPCGPYHTIGYGVVPGNAMPKGPVQDLYDLHLSINKILRKILFDAENEKEVLPVSGGSMDQAGRLMQARHAEMVKYQGEIPKPVRFGTVNPASYQLLMGLREMFSWGAGNLEVLGGLAPQSKTATQDQLLAQNSAGTVADKVDTTTRFISRISKALCWFWYHHPDMVMRTKYSPPGAPEISTVRELHPYNPVSPEHGMRMALGKSMRRVPFDQLSIQVDPYSLRHQTPEQRSTELLGIVKEVLLPFLPMGQQQGIGLDLNALLSKIGRLRNQPDLAEIITYSEPTAPQGAEAPGMPAQTERTYTRRSMGGADSAGSQENERANAMSAAAAADGQ